MWEPARFSVGLKMLIVCEMCVESQAAMIKVSFLSSLAELRVCVLTEISLHKDNDWLESLLSSSFLHLKQGTRFNEVM